MHTSDIQQHFYLSFLYTMQRYIRTGHPSFPFLTWRESQPPFGNLYQINKTAISSMSSRGKLLHFTLTDMSSSEQTDAHAGIQTAGTWHQLAYSSFLPVSGFQTQRYRQAEYSRRKMVRLEVTVLLEERSLLLQSKNHPSTNPLS